MKKIIFIIATIFYFVNIQAQSEYELCEKALAKIQEKNYSEFKGLFCKIAMENTSDESIKFLVDKGAVFIDKYGLPARENVLTKNQYYLKPSGEHIEISYFEYQFPVLRDKTAMPDRVIMLGFVGKKDSLASFRVMDYVASDSIATVQRSKIPFLKKLQFNAKDIAWFRIYYGQGSTNKIPETRLTKGGNFAVSGKYENVKSLQLDKDFKELFALLAQSPVEKTTYRYGMPEKRKGDSEYVFYRFTFNKAPADGFDELSIKVVLSEEDGYKEEDYIFVAHNMMNRYFISKSKNPKLFEKLKTIAYKNYNVKTED